MEKIDRNRSNTKRIVRVKRSKNNNSGSMSGLKDDKISEQLIMDIEDPFTGKKQ